jgi:hypothetical protein
MTIADMHAALLHTIRHLRSAQQLHAQDYEAIALDYHPMLVLGNRTYLRREEIDAHPQHRS